MKRLLFLTVALIVSASCQSNTSLQASKVVVIANAPRVENPKPDSTDGSKDVAKESERKAGVPPEFRGIDFKNFSYPTSFRRKPIRLQAGEYEERNGMGGESLHFIDVSYFDLTGDLQKEAIVQVSWLICGGSCDGGSDIFYFYTINHGKSRLLSRIEMGSLGYDCSLKSFTLSKTNLTLETFRSCRFNGLSFKSAYDANETGGKFLTNRFTQFILRFNGRKFVLRKRKVFPYPEDDFRGYAPKISISDD